MKEEALKLADELDELHQYVPSEAPAMIRRLVEELDKQGEPVAWWSGKSKFCSPEDKSYDAKTGGILSFGCNIPLYTTPQTKPLSDEEITAIWQKDECYQNAQAFARAIIKEMNK